MSTFRLALDSIAVGMPESGTAPWETVQLSYYSHGSLQRLQEAVNTFTAPGVLSQTLGTSFFGPSIGLASNYDSEGGL